MIHGNYPAVRVRRLHVGVHFQPDDAHDSGVAGLPAAFPGFDRDSTSASTIPAAVDRRPESGTMTILLDV